MADYLIKDTTLTNIADAIRAKKSSTDTYTPAEMATAISSIETGAAEPVIEALSVTANGTYTAPDGVDGYSPITVNVPQDGSPPDEAFVLSGNCENRFAYNGWNWFIEKYGNQITTENINSSNRMFYSCKNLLEIPFDINFSSSSSYHFITSTFESCDNLTKLPKLNNVKPYETKNMFSQCFMVRNIPDDFTSTWDWSYLDGQTNSYSGNQSWMFYYCYSLRSLPISLISHGNPYINYSYNYFYYGFYYCYTLDELVNLPIPYTNSTWASNAFGYTFNNCCRLKNMIFAMQEDGTPYVMNWKSQTIDLSNYLGYVQNKVNVLNYNSGITADKEVTDDTTYQALKNDADWFTTNVAYSRYNHDSAVATINSLPDTSAYLASAGGTNTIKFKGDAGSATDGGAINTLTEEEIAVATAKGWSVVYV